MRTFAWIAVAGALQCFLVAQCEAEDDLAPVGSEWIGTFKRFGRKGEGGSRVSSTDARLKMLERKDAKFKAELWLDKNAKGLALEGTISPRGVLKASVTKVLKGEFAPDVVGRTEGDGSVANGLMKMQYKFPGGRRFGDIELRLKTKEPSPDKSD
jgi:hypothetical protein